MRALATITILLLLSACSKSVRISKNSEGFGLGGLVDPLSGIVFHRQHSLWAQAYAAVCDATVYARLYQLNADGSLAADPVASVVVSNGRYDFPASVTPASSVTTVSYQVMIDGCDQYLSRPVTSFDGSQDVTWGSSLVGATAFAYLGVPIVQAEGATVKTLIDSLVAASVITNYTNLAGSAGLTAVFSSMFADSPVKLLDSHPYVSHVTIPTVISEGLPTTYEIRALHFDPVYSKAYEWHIDGLERSITPTLSYSPGADDSGDHSLVLFVGQNDGSSRVDRTKPYYTVTKTIRVLDTLPATAPAFSIGAAATNTPSISLSLSTGAGLSNCASFSHFLIAQGGTRPVASDPGFTGVCTIAPTQSEAFTLTGADGSKPINLWVRDSAGNVSAVPATQSIYLDRVAPTVALSGITSKYRGGAALSFTYSTSDTGSGLASVELYFSFNAGPFVKIKDLVATATSDSFTLPAADVLDGKVRIIATDAAGNTNSVTSSNFEIDSTPPGALAISRTSAAFSNSLTVGLAATCTGVSEILLGESVNGTDTAGWQSCAATLSHVLSGTTQGIRTIKAYARDDVGNVSALSTVTMTYDSTAPVATFTATPSALSSESTYSFQFTGSDNLSAAAALSYECSLNGVVFGACTSPDTRNGFLTGANSYRVRAIDQAGNVSAIITHSWSFDSSEPTLSYTSVASLSPSPSKSLLARSISVGGTNVLSYKYTVIRSGTCSSVDYSALSETVLAGNTSFSFTPTTDGTYQVCGIAKSTYGVWQQALNASGSPVLTIDTVAPTITSSTLSPGPFGSTTTPTVSGAAEGSSTMTLHLNSASCASAALATVTADAGTGAYSLTATALTVDGAYNFYVKSTDAAGNSTCSAALPYTLDRVAPSVALTNFLGGEIIKGSQANNITWTATDLNFNVSPIKFEYSLNAGTNWTQISAAEANTGTYAWSTPGFNSSTAKVRVTATDKAGNTSTSTTSTTFTIDSTAPILTLNNLLGGQILAAGSSQAILWTATDANTSGNWISLSYSSDGGTTWTAIASTTNTGTYAWTVPAGVDSSTYRVRVVATDSVGQVSTATSTSNFTIDATPPSVTLTSFTGGQAILGSSNQTISWSASDLNFGATPITLSLSSNSGASWSTIASNIPNTGSYAWQANVADGGNYRIRVTATDAAGLSSTSASSADFVVSSQAPNLSQTLVASPYYSKTATQLTFGGTCDNGYVVTISGAETATTSCAGGTWSWTTATYNTDASRVFNFSQTNAVLTLTVSATWVRDTTPPALVAVSLNNDDAQTPAPIVSVAVTTTEAGISVRLANATSSGASCQDVYADDGWRSQSSLITTFSHLLSSGDGNKKVCAWLKDQAGNVSAFSPATGNLGVDMDTITYASGNPPQAVSFNVINDGGGVFQGLNSAYQNDPLKMTWTVTDVEGLSNNPVYLDYTTNGTTWTPIESAYGGLGGNPGTYSDTYYGFSAPTSSFFRVRIRVRDSAGNFSSELMSKAFNTSPWSVFAGGPGRGVGGSAKSAYVLRSQVQFANFAMNPTTGDVYFIDHGFGIKKVSATTGLVSSFISHCGYNMGSSGTISSSSCIDTSSARLLFDNKGFLYLFTDNTYLVFNENSERVLRINTSTLEYTTYLGKGTSNATGANPTDTFVLMSNAITFDESNTLYFLTSCTPGVRFVRDPATTSAVALMKVTQNADGTPGTVSRVAGNCVRGTPVSGVSALSNPYSNISDGPWQNSVVAWGNGRYIYYSDGAGNGYKIIDGVTYRSTIGFYHGGMYYDRVSNQIKVAYVTVSEYTPSLAGDNGETLNFTLAGNGTGANCADDGTPAAQVCGQYYSGTLSSSGKLFFIEGFEGTLNRLRYLDDNGNIQTLVGSLSFSGAGQIPSSARGNFGGVYYKKATQPLPLEYPEGLYFLERYGGVFGYFSSNMTYKIAGNQSGVYPTFGAPVTSSSSLGLLLGQNLGAMSAFTFDLSGRMWYRSANDVIMLDETKSLVLKSTSPSDFWYLAPEGADPRNYHLYPYGGWQNFTVKDSGKFFLMGGWNDTSNSYTFNKDPYGKIRIFDYENNVVKYVIGTNASAVTPQQTSEGSLKNASMGDCGNNTCAMWYDQDTDRIYFTEYNMLRYITNPEDPSHHTLIDVFASTKGGIDNFSLSPDKKYVMYLVSGRLYCHAVSAADDSAICKNNPASHIDLGPTAGLGYISKGPNQMTWKNNSVLYISTYLGEIYEYLLYH